MNKPYTADELNKAISRVFNTITFMLLVLTGVVVYKTVYHNEPPMQVKVVCEECNKEIYK